MTATQPGIDSLASEEVVTLIREAIRIDTSNYGNDEGPGEAEAAEWAQARLEEAGLDVERFSTVNGRRQGVVTRIPGANPDRPALLLHGHLDVVPAIADDWSVPPFAAEVIDDVVYGRGAVDMKDSIAMTLSVVRAWARTGSKPDRDIVVMMTPDEEAGSTHGASWLVQNRPELFHGVTEAVGEVGGYSLTINDDLRLYTVQTAEKGIEWLRLTASGRAGHGSLINDDNSVTKLAEAVARVGGHQFPVVLGPTAEGFLDGVSEALGLEFDRTDPEAVLRQLGPVARFIGATLRDTANPSMLSAGYKVNVIPETAEAHIDCRYLPGRREEFLAELRELIGDGVKVEHVHSDIALETTFDGPTIDAMAAALHEVDPGARTIPYMLSGGTDGKSFSALGIRCFGFVPLRLPADLDFAGLFHGVDERVPVQSLQFGVQVLDRFLRSA